MSSSSIDSVINCFLTEQFPAYLQNPPSDLSPADKTRFEKQNEYVAQIVKIFEDPKYDENDKVIGGKVAELMGEVSWSYSFWLTFRASWMYLHLVGT